MSSSRMLPALAPELLYRILRLCSGTDLVSLSQVNSVLQAAAEYLLYRNIYLSIYPFNLIKDKTWKSWELSEEKCDIHTLASNPKKAALVRSFHIQFEPTAPYDADDANEAILIKIANALEHTTQLVDLRLMIDQNDSGDFSRGRISRVIGFVRYRSYRIPCLTAMAEEASSSSTRCTAISCKICRV